MAKLKRISTTEQKPCLPVGREDNTKALEGRQDY